MTFPIVVAMAAPAVPWPSTEIKIGSSSMFAMVPIMLPIIASRLAPSARTMKLAAAEAIASLVSDEELSADYILPKAFDPRVGKTVAEAVAKAARDSGVARI